MFKILVEIDGELENIDDQCTDELKFEDIGQKVFSFKHKAHNWLREVEKQDKLGRSSKSSSMSSSKTPALPDHQKGHQPKKWQLLRS